MDDLDRSIAKRTAANPHYPEMLAAELRRQEPDRSDASARRVRVFSDWNRLDGEGRIRLGLMGHVSTDFTALVGVLVLFVDGDEVVEGTVATGETVSAGRHSSPSRPARTASGWAWPIGRPIATPSATRMTPLGRGASGSGRTGGG